MYKILSVSTNLDTHQMIKKAVQSMPDQFRLCSQFTNAVDALEIAAAQKPDIIFFNDQMYFIGISQFIRSLARKGVRASYVILQNDSHTPYQLHNLNLVKKIVPESTLTLEILQELLADLHVELNKKAPLSYYSSFPYANDSFSFPWMAENHIFAQLINDPLEDRSQTCDIDIPSRGYLLMGSPRCLPGENFSFFRDLQKLNLFFDNAKLLLETYGKGNLFIIQENKLCVWICPSDMNTRPDRFFAELCGSINSVFDFEPFSQLVFQRSNAPSNLSQLPQTYRAVDRLSTYRFFVDDQTILHSDWLTAHSEVISLDDIQNILNGLEQNFEQRDLMGYQNCIEDLFHYARRSLSFNTYSHIWNQLIFWYNLKVQQHSLPTDQYIPTFGQSSFARLEDAQQSIILLFKELFDATSTAHLQSGSYYVSRAISYLSTNFTDAVTLSDVADHIHITPAYLSQLFQKELGKSFVEVRTDLRINMAKDLLKKNYKIYEVALMTGFSNEKYFSQTFKKITGVTPRAYRTGSEDSYEMY